MLGYEVIAHLGIWDKRGGHEEEVYYQLDDNTFIRMYVFNHDYPIEVFTKEELLEDLDKEYDYHMTYLNDCEIRVWYSQDCDKDLKEVLKSKWGA